VFNSHSTKLYFATTLTTARFLSSMDRKQDAVTTQTCVLPAVIQSVTYPLAIRMSECATTFLSNAHLSNSMLTEDLTDVALTLDVLVDVCTLTLFATTRTEEFLVSQLSATQLPDLA